MGKNSGVEKKVLVENAIGMILAHDLTQIIPGKSKGVRFKRGHIVQEKDIPELLKLGKRHLYILDLSSGERLHEDDAARRIARAVSGDNLTWTEPGEGKISMISEKNGLFKVNVEGLLQINCLGEISLSTLKTNFPCHKDHIVAATRIIPLTIPITRIEELERVAQRFRPVLQVLPYRRLRVGAVVTGFELFTGLIKDEFDQYVGRKILNAGCEIVKKIVVIDDAEAISEAINHLIEIGCELIVTTGGLSVDPDDVTPTGIQRSGAKTLAYGSPVFPGAMFLYALLEEKIPILGLPACVYYHVTTIFDLIFPRILAGEHITQEAVAEMGHGGLCMNCKQCSYPICPFGK